MMLRFLILFAIGYSLWRWWTQALGPAKKHKPSGGRSNKNPWDVLEIKPGATTAEIKRAYQDKISQYHPDKVQNLAPELQTLAEERSKEINAAYEALKRGGSA